MSPNAPVSVDVGSVTKDSRGFISVWTKTHYALPQTATGMQYSAKMTRFELDCASTQDDITGGKFLDALGKVPWQFNEPVDESQRISVASEMDTVARTMCTAGDDVWRCK
ncbi:hypothetical protein MMB18_38575 (plasmid) [Burkholderia contaminans]|nr:hypothetical protein [Burkholderia contaminans]UMY33429.1 hypothetical protein MMB18_38575 [Burkholderia contaminans]